MLDLILYRKYYKATYTIGWLFARQDFVCDTLEDKVRDLDNEPKVKGATAIPDGRYKVRLTYSPKFSGRVWGIKYGGLVPEILDVPHFSAVRIHPGCSENDTEGCPLTGLNKVKGGLVDAVKCYYKLMDEYLMPAHKAGEDIIIDVM